jgi:hypothetical protein
MELPVPAPTKRRRNIYRPTKERPELEELLIQWRTEMHSRFNLRAIRPPTFILDADAIKKLTMAPASKLSTLASLTLILKQSPEWEYLWAQSLFKLISEYEPTVMEQDESDEDGPQPKRSRK